MANAALRPDAFGRIDVVVNNAGILRDRFFFNMSVEEWRAVIDVHLNGSFYVRGAPRAALQVAASGCYVHMTSTSGLVGNLGQLSGGEARHRRPVEVDRARHGKYNVRSNCISPFAWSRMIGSIPTETEAGARGEAEVMETCEDRSARRLPRFGFRSKDITGQIFAVRANEIFLMSQNRPLRSVHRAEGWTPAKRRLARHPRRCATTSTRSIARRTCSPGTRCEARAAQRSRSPPPARKLLRARRRGGARAGQRAVDTLRSFARDVDGVITRSKLPDDLFDAAPRVRAVVVHGTGTDLVPLADATARGVMVANLPGINAQSVAEYCAMAMLMLARNILAITSAFPERQTWDEARALGAGAREIAGMTARHRRRRRDRQPPGEDRAQRLRHARARPPAAPRPPAGRGAQPATLDDLLCASATSSSSPARSRPETRHLFNAKTLRPDEADRLADQRRPRRRWSRKKR